MSTEQEDLKEFMRFLDIVHGHCEHGVYHPYQSLSGTVCPSKIYGFYWVRDGRFPRIMAWYNEDNRSFTYIFPNQAGLRTYKIKEKKEPEPTIEDDIKAFFERFEPSTQKMQRAVKAFMAELKNDK